MDLKHEKAVHQEEMKSKEDERQKLVLDLKKEKAVHKESSIEGSREGKVGVMDLKNAKAVHESKNLKLKGEVEKMELEIERLQNLPKGGGCCVVM